MGKLSNRTIMSGGHFLRWWGGFLFVLTAPAWGWSDHASLVWPLLREQPDIVTRSVPAESLRQFLTAEQNAIAQTLDDVEVWSAQNIAHYPLTPASLLWRNSSGPIVERFLSAIRVNPSLSYPLYVGPSPERSNPVVKPLPWSALSFLGGGNAQQASRYWSLTEGESVSVAEVLATASDEPDLGMDIGLFDDNGTAFGQRYGFGRQPFGNPNLDYGSQAPFHMGFYHLDWLARVAQPDLQRTYPLWRIALFGELADVAFRTGHPYWGWRFLGWGLHYVGDLTQPYHAVPLPGVSTLQALWSVLQGKTSEMVQLVSNRHGVIESYQYQRLKAALAAEEWSAPLLRAVAEQGNTEPLEYTSFVMDLTRASVAAASEFDAVIATHVSPRFVSDPNFEWTGSGFEVGLVDTVRRERGQAAVTQLDAVVAEQLERFSRVASQWIARGHLPPEEAAKRVTQQEAVMANE